MMTVNIHLLSQIYLHCDVDAIFLCAGMNARIVDLHDTILNIDTIPPRHVMDKTVHQHGMAVLINLLIILHLFSVRENP